MIYFVATPIGNLKDITIRAIETLQNVDVIACEDTRNSLKLLNHYNISKKLIAYHKFNEKSSADGIVNLARQGKNIAIISDAGMPVISDPGQILVKKLIENNVPYTVIPGASASLSALLLSGMESATFTFVGFLSEQNKIRRQQIENIKNISSTLIFYVSPYNVKKDIEFLCENLGDRNACLVSEITKIHEKVTHFSLANFCEQNFMGEYVLIVDGAKTKENENANLSIEDELKSYIESGMEKQNAIKQVAKNRKLKKNEVYQIALKLDKN